MSQLLDLGHAQAVAEPSVEFDGGDTPSLERRLAGFCELDPVDLYGPMIAHVVVLAAATVLSVFKPRGRTSRGRRTLPSDGRISPSSDN